MLLANFTPPSVGTKPNYNIPENDILFYIFIVYSIVTYAAKNTAGSTEEMIMLYCVAEAEHNVHNAKKE